LLKRLSSQRAISKSGPRFCVRSRALYEEAHDLIAKPPTLWRIMRVPFSGLLLERSWTIKFERQFKVRDERDINARVAPQIQKSQK
jgi:hypothetical protein